MTWPAAIATLGPFILAIGAWLVRRGDLAELRAQAAHDARLADEKAHSAAMAVLFREATERERSVTVFGEEMRAVIERHAEVAKELGELVESLKPREEPPRERARRTT